MKDFNDLQVGKTYWYLSKVYSSGKQLSMKDDEGNLWTRWVHTGPQFEVIEIKYLGATRIEVYFDGLAQWRDEVVELTRENYELPEENSKLHYFEATDSEVWYIRSNEFHELARVHETKEEAEKEVALAADFLY